MTSLIRPLGVLLALLGTDARADQCDTNGGVVQCNSTRNADVDADFFDWIGAGWLQSDSYNACTTEDHDDPEDAYIFTCQEDGDVTVFLNNLECDLDLLILDDECNGDTACIAHSSRGSTTFEQVTFTCESSHIYYFVIERQENSLNPFADCNRYNSHDYRIDVECHEECDDGFDNDGDNLLDCFDPDCPPCQETCDDQRDNDFDGLVDCNDPDCADLPYCCDVDADGYYSSAGICGGDDCNDNPITNGHRINPGADENIGDGIDSDCDGFEKCYVDEDGDFFGVPTEVNSLIFTCLGEGVANNDGDCDDTNPDINPDIAEIVANGQDDDCDGNELCYLDEDGDDFGGQDVITSPDFTCSTGVYATNADDCDDGDAATFPGAEEFVASGKDEDCDGLEECYFDADNDSYGVDSTLTTSNIACIGIGVSIRNDDCDDTPGTGSVIFPDAEETRADGIDSNCDGLEECWADQDVDGFGNNSGDFIATQDTTCTTDGVSLNDLDCDDADPNTYPGAIDPPGDGIDQDCDDLQDCYQDLDGDGFGSDVFVESSAPNCAGVGVANVPGDCDDLQPQINPDAIETENDGIDQNCDGFELCYLDQDGDEYGSSDLVAAEALDCVAPGVAPNDDDCNDVPPLGANINPAQVEDPNTPYDDNCDELYPCYQDLDNDGFGRDVIVESTAADCDLGGFSPNNLDCDDSPTGFRINPNIGEVPADGIDQDCDGQERCYRDLDQDGFGVDIFALSNDFTCRDPGVADRNDDCDDADPDVYPGSSVGYNCGDEYPCFLDQDFDGFGGQIVELVADPTCTAPGYSPTDDDCNDNPLAGGQQINPNAFETPNDQLDSDCDGFELCYQDNDSDGFGTINLQQSADVTCNADGVSRFDTDCNDNPSDNGDEIYPGAPEQPASGADENCDGREDCYVDADADGYGIAQLTDTTDITCRGGFGYADNADDCEDRLSDVHPGAPETPANNTDENCDGFDTCYQDLDGDGFGTLTEVQGTDPGLTCNGDGVSSSALDCYDVPPDGATVFPGADEVPGNARDDNCDGLEMCFNDADSDGFGGTVPIESPDLLCNGGGLAPLNDDCNDIPLQGEGINPGADEVAADGVDQNCDGAEDCYQDLDRDRYGSQSIATSTALDCFADGVAANSDDCYDISPGGELINPGATEQPGSGIDENCDGLESCFQDVDADGYGNGTIQESPTIDCSEVGVSRTSDDCNDALPEINPGAIELPADLVDQNCDREEDCYRDEDADDFGSTVIVSSPILTCDGVNVADNDEDCNDTLPAGAFIFPGATEVPGNGIDEDCDGGESCYIDADGDGFGGLNTTVTTAFDCNAPDATTVGGDCDDSNVGINPDADEVPVNGIDEDCDGGDLCYRDIDGDGFGSTEFIASADLFCTGTGEATNNTDCLDVGTVGIVAAAEIYPGAPEMCNEVDDDCDTLIDDDDTNLVDGFTWYLDADGDDFGQTGITTLACSQPSGYASDDGDCNDGNAGINPDAQEVCDPADNDEDCDGEADENDVNLFGGVDAIGAFVAYPDLDGDLYGDSDPTRAVFVCELSPGLVEDNTDCYDLPPGGIQVNPGLDEIPYDGFDNDCDPATPDDDLDGDGFGHNDDCNDVPGSGFSVNPSSSEGLFADGIDNDCNGFVDDGTSAFDDDGDGWTEDGGDCDDTDPEVHPGAVERANQRDDDCDNVNDDGTDLYDDDGDGFTEAEGDCNDAVGAVNPGATEIMDDGVDNDCDGAVDAGSYDPDGDGYTEGGGDCNPENGNVFPEAPELADGLDNDCDGTIDEGTFAYDDDGDGYTEQTGDCNDVPGAGELVNPGQREVANGIDDNCDGTIDEGSDNADDDSDGYAENQGDCDDTNPQRYPGADEIDNGIDDDCDGAVDEDASDLDGDGFTVAAGDCDDSNGWANPEETEVCDGIDNDCDGATDNIPGCTDVDDTGLPQPKPPGCNCNGTGTGTQSLPFFALLLAGLRRRQRSRK